MIKAAWEAAWSYVIYSLPVNIMYGRTGTKY